MPYSQFLRVRRICSSTEDFETKAIEMGKNFICRGYPDKIISEAFIKTLRTPRHTLLLDKELDESKTENNKNFYGITTFHPTFKGYKSTITNNWDFLTKSNQTKNLHEHRVIYGNRRSKNLRDELVRAKLVYPKPPKAESTTAVAHGLPCATKSCRYCPKIDTTGTITSTYTNRTYSTKIRVDCKSNNLVYCITCKTCKSQYVGMTMNRLMDRFQGHFYNITSKRKEHAIGRHFNLPNHNGLEDVQIHIVDFIHMAARNPNAVQLRLKIERNWQHRLHTIAPLGLNIKD